MFLQDDLCGSPLLLLNVILNNLGPVNISASWTNQGPQQWDQTGSVDNQGGQYPQSTIPQDQYTQIDQNAQLQNGTVFYSK